MQLYSFFNSSTSYRVRIALALKGLDYQVLPVNLRQGEQLRPAERERNPMGAVPTLVDDDDLLLSQSLAIIDYLDALRPEPRLIPFDPRQRAQALELALLVACDIHPLNNVRVLKYLTQVLGIDTEARQRWYAHWVAEGLAAAETLLNRHARGAFFTGEAPGIVECCLVPQLVNARRMGCDLSPYPGLLELQRRCLALDAFQRASPERQPDYLPD
ncbi:maleylacetoacetate isomerase [Pseudomonas paraeruginosa]|uniref:maleylacetoacetate isomerase n=1 Tax=Pseudomonas aeruginosa group TaxID=136841 RepID=UPI00053D7785|nr:MULTISPECIES: maleylacetoacetate isomerase [Pseudomonas aeruginosa group]KAB0743793.1 maleylacetoacetate isomerase [Pseudomonas aeruginosa]KSP85493.1 maleylacetoacetate isomerase [Pseudomonas aeruginosa]MBG4069867.1 maleylacetoacetate isomerase [Pseudomonas aeruginosa]MBG5602849.1 maleylacetoacetate isomerase [Pseudomonas aeruginosa]MBH3673677.1 maleylacetoacetate isomerase [Pseudomonas aeruginosa]